MLRRIHADQPASFAFTTANQAWAKAQITKFPKGRQASAIIPLLWRAQEQEGWLTRPAIECVAEMLDMAYMRALEVASFYFMFQLQPVGSVAHIQICGTTSCMICGAEDLVTVCKQRISSNPHELSADGKFSWEEVECLGACANAPMAQIGKDYYEDLSSVILGDMLDQMAAGKVPTPGPQNGRYASEPQSGLSSLTDHAAGCHARNASATMALAFGDTLKRIEGTETNLKTPWMDRSDKSQSAAVAPTRLERPRDGAGDLLSQIKGIGPKLQAALYAVGIFHFEQIAGWTSDEVAWVEENIVSVKGRASRDDWVAKARALIETEVEDDR